MVRFFSAVRAALTAPAVSFFVIATLSLQQLWRTRARARTMGRRALLPYTAVLLVLGVAIFGIEMYAVSSAVRLSATGAVFAGLVPGVNFTAEILINVLGQVVALMNDAFLVWRAPLPPRCWFADSRGRSTVRS
jgi:hypothetical protein